jgi:hypothetical protein
LKNPSYVARIPFLRKTRTMRQREGERWGERREDEKKSVAQVLLVKKEEMFPLPTDISGELHFHSCPKV